MAWLGSNPLNPAGGGTGVNNGTKTITLGSPTSGYVLTSDASGNATWQAGGGGGSGSLVLLSSQTASNSTAINFTSFVSASYRYYQLQLTDVIPATNNEATLMQVSSNNGSSYISTGYTWATSVLYYGAEAFESGTQSGTVLHLQNASSNSSAGSSSGIYNLYDLNNPTLYFKLTGLASQWEAGNIFTQRSLMGGYPVAVALNAFTIFMNSGNISSGTFNLYGVV